MCGKCRQFDIGFIILQMSLESEARRLLEAQKRAAHVVENKKEANRQAEEARKKALELESQQAKSRALSKFRSLSPERLLNEVRSAWRTGGIVRFNDPLYKRFSGDHYGEDGLMLFQKGGKKHKHDQDSRPSYYTSTVEGGESYIMHVGRHRVEGYKTDVDTDYYPVDVAVIHLGYGSVKLMDRSGRYSIKRTRHRSDSLFAKTNETVNEEYMIGDIMPPVSFDINTVTSQDIHSFFVKTTALRMEGIGHIRIR